MADTEGRVPLDLRTPITEGSLVVSGLADIWESWGNLKMEIFWDHIFKSMWDDNATTAEPYLNELEVIEGMRVDHDGNPWIPNGKEAAIQIAVMRVACAYAVQAMRPGQKAGVGWSHTCEAHRWLGILQGIISGRGMANGHSAFAKLGAHARHAETRQMKKDVFDWCDANMVNFKSLDAASAAVAEKIVPVTFRTVRDWMSEWKKLRSAGTL